MSVVEGNADAVQSLLCKEFCIGCSEKIVKELCSVVSRNIIKVFTGFYFVKEELIFLLTKYFQHGSTMFMFMTWKPRDKILHIHMSTEPGLGQGQLWLFCLLLQPANLLL